MANNKVSIIRYNDDPYLARPADTTEMTVHQASDALDHGRTPNALEDGRVEFDLNRLSAKRGLIATCAEAVRTHLQRQFEIKAIDQMAEVFRHATALVDAKTELERARGRLAYVQDRPGPYDYQPPVHYSSPVTTPSETRYGDDDMKKRELKRDLAKVDAEIAEHQARTAAARYKAEYPERFVVVPESRPRRAKEDKLREEERKVRDQLARRRALQKMLRNEARKEAKARGLDLDEDTCRQLELELLGELDGDKIHGDKTL